MLDRVGGENPGYRSIASERFHKLAHHVILLAT